MSVGVEATGSFRWFQRLLAELGQELLLGDPGAIHGAQPRKQKTDKRDARHLLRLLLEDRFPAVWQPPQANEQTRQLLLHRCRLVRLRTRMMNQLDALAKNEGLVMRKGWSRARREAIESLPLSGWDTQRRTDLLELLDELDGRVRPLDEAVEKAAWENRDARLLMSHPGVGPIVSLAYVLTIGEWQRFARGKHVASYLGLIPAEDSSSDKRRLGHISKQGNSLVRWLLVEAALNVQRFDPKWHRQYVRLSMTKHRMETNLAGWERGLVMHRDCESGF